MASADMSDIRRMIGQLKNRMGDMSPVMRAVSQDMYQAVTDNFLAGGRPRWDPLRPSTIANREKNGTWPGQILHQSGQLKNSITPFSDRTSAGVGTNKPYAKTHQFGARKGQYGRKTVVQQVRQHLRRSRSGRQSTVRAHRRTRTIAIPWGNVKKRPFFVLPDDAVADITDTLRSFLDGVS